MEGFKYINGESTEKKNVNAFELFNIKTLILNNMQDLQNFDVHASHLTNLSLDNCKNLESAYFPIEKLKSYSIVNCTKLEPYYLSLLILNGVRVLLNSNSCNKKITE